MLLYGPTRMINYENMVPDKDHFSPEEPFAWAKCRETFYDKFTPATIGFFFSHPNDTPHSIYEFILKTEETLRFAGVSCESTKMSLTNRDYAVWVEPSTFWKGCEFKRSLFTILLRCGSNYKNDYEEALISNSYIKDTYVAVKRFLFGYTEYSNSGSELKSSFIRTDNQKKGWVTNFKGLSKDEVKLLLRRPSDKENVKNFYGVGSIWS